MRTVVTGSSKQTEQRGGSKQAVKQSQGYIACVRPAATMVYFPAITTLFAFDVAADIAVGVS